MTGRVATACGKVILLGEHAVVYGVPAIAVGIDRGARAVATWLQEGPSKFRVAAWGVEGEADDSAKDLSRAFRAALDVSKVTRPVCVEAWADLPPGGGLGCSAALGVAALRALDPSASDAEVAERVTDWERVFHGNPSGIDGAVATHGGCVLFEKSRPFERVRVPKKLTLCIGNSGQGSSTKSMVDSVARQRERRPEVVEKAFEGVRSLVRNARLAIEAGDDKALGQLMNLNQMILSGLFVSTEALERLCDRARASGAYGAKLTGAGGGGCVVALVPDREVAANVLEGWKGEGFEGFSTEVAPTGGGSA